MRLLSACKAFWYTLRGGKRSIILIKEWRFSPATNSSKEVEYALRRASRECLRHLKFVGHKTSGIQIILHKENNG